MASHRRGSEWELSGGRPSRRKKVTPLGGRTYEAAAHEVLGEIAAGLGDEYVDTTPGAIPNDKKGDGLFRIAGDEVRLVVEMTNRSKRDWTAYLDEAERNRQAVASLGLVPSADQLGGHTVRCLGPRRVLLAYDPENDDPGLLRRVVQLLRLAALAVAARHDGGEIATAEEKLAEALALLPSLDGIKKRAGAIRKAADGIEQDCDGVRVSLDRLLAGARSALAGAAVADRTA